MINQRNRSNSALFVSFTLSMLASTAALVLSLLEGYTPFSRIKLPAPANDNPYLMMKYADAQERIFLSLTISLMICESSNLIGFFLTLVYYKKPLCLKSPQCMWLVYNKLNLLYLVAATGAITTIIFTSWQTIILVDILMPSQSTSTVSIATLVCSYLTLCFLLIEVILVIRERKYEIWMENNFERIAKIGEITIQNEMKRYQRNDQKDERHHSVKTTKKNIKSTKKKQILNQEQNNDVPEIKYGLLQVIRQGQIYQIQQQYQNNQPKQNSPQDALIQAEQIQISRESQKKKVVIPKLPIDEVKAKNNLQRAKNRSLSMLDISIIKPPGVENREIFKQEKPNRASILCKINEGRIPQEGARSPRPEIPKLNQAIKNDNITSSPNIFSFLI